MENAPLKTSAPEGAISWEAHEYRHAEKSADWYWALGLIAAIAAAGAVFYNNLLFAFVVVLGAGTLAIYAARRPRRVSFTLARKGIAVGGEKHPYRTLDSFWVADEDNEEDAKLIIKSKKLLLPYLIIPLDGADPDEVREYLAAFLPEEEHEESLAEKLMERLGF